MKIRLFVLWVIALALFVACGGKKDGEDAKTSSAEASLDDALALLPGNAIAVGSVDARAFFSSKTFGAQLASTVEKYIPIGKEAGFEAARDLDRITWATYSYQGVDAAAIVVGRFDEAKIKQVAASQTPTKMNAPLVVSQYAGRDLYTVSNIGFTLLTKERAVVGTEGAIRRVLERIKDKRVKRDILPWMIATVETPGAAATAAADFASQPMPQEVLRQVNSPVAKDLKALRVLMNFKENGIQLAASGTFADEAAAGNAKGQVEQVASLAKWLSLIGVKIQNIDIKADKQDVQLKAEVDDQSLKALLQAVPQLLGG